MSPRLSIARVLAVSHVRFDARLCLPDLCLPAIAACAPCLPWLLPCVFLSASDCGLSLQSRKNGTLGLESKALTAGSTADKGSSGSQDDSIVQALELDALVNDETSLSNVIHRLKGLFFIGTKKSVFETMLNPLLTQHAASSVGQFTQLGPHCCSLVRSRSLELLSRLSAVWCTFACLLTSLAPG